MPSAARKIEEKRDELGKKLREVDRLLGKPSDRDSQRALMAKRRSEGRDIEIPAPVDWLRRQECEADVYRFLETYFSKRFTNPWDDNQRDMIDAILRRARYGGDQSIAAPRGEGKTTIAETVTIFSLLTGILRFPLLVAATGPDAERILSNIKAEIEFNDLLAEDYPEVCEPVRALVRCSSTLRHANRSRSTDPNEVVSKYRCLSESSCRVVQSMRVSECFQNTKNGRE